MCVCVGGEGVAPNVLHMHFHTVEHKCFYFLFLLFVTWRSCFLSSHITGVGCNVLSSHGRTGR